MCVGNRLPPKMWQFFKKKCLLALVEMFASTWFLILITLENQQLCSNQHAFLIIISLCFL